MTSIRIDESSNRSVAPKTEQPSATLQVSGSVITIDMLPGEMWWGGAVEDAGVMPLSATSVFQRDLARPRLPEASSSQSSPLLVSTTGRYVWSDEPFAFSVEHGVLALQGRKIAVWKAGETLRDAYRAASLAHFAPTGRLPARALFTGPQYNTWIESPYSPTQESVLAYVRRILDSGLPPGVVMIDDSWCLDYGVWEFDRARFPDPAAMVAQLADWGCPVMLWTVPFVSPDSAAFRELERAGLLVKNADGSTAVRRWWNGYSALLDITNDEATAWLRGRLDALVVGTGVDGFKFDGGDLAYVEHDDLLAGGGGGVDYSQAWARFGIEYPFNEFRACWKSGGEPLAQRLQDKPPSWGQDGIGSLIPELLTQGLLGHPFGCPDMIGGGEIVAMQSASGIDQEFFVRYAQIAAIAPMMQFSVSPARVLDDEHHGAVLGALALREHLLPKMLELVEAAAVTGEPILRPMSYHEADLAHVRDQFFLGEDLFFAPVVHAGVQHRDVAIPAGRWRDDTGAEVTGPATISVPVDLTRIPHFSRVVDDAATNDGVERGAA